MLKKVHLKGYSVIILAIMSFMIVLYSSVNMIQLKQEVKENTRDYVNTYTAQLAHFANQVLYDKKAMLETIADSMSGLPYLDNRVLLQSYLQRKREICGFDFMAYMDLNEEEAVICGLLPEPFSGDKNDILGKDIIKKALNEKGCVIRMINENAIYAVKIYSRYMGSGILWAGYDKDHMQDILKSKVFKEKSYSCIVNSSGKVILSAEDSYGFDSLENMVYDGADDKLGENIRQMRANLRDKKGGIFSFRSESGQGLYLSYDPMEINNWSILTVIPENLFADATTAYVSRVMICVWAVSLAIFLVFCLYYRKSADYRKELERLAFVDEVTGGINNGEFQRLFRRMREGDQENRYGIIIFDIIDFNDINKRYGTLMGNQFLKHIYEVMESRLNKSEHEAVVRSETDHFFVIMKETDKKKLQNRIDEIISAINEGEKEKGLPVVKISFRQGGCITDCEEAEISVYQDRARMAMKSRYAEALEYCIFYNSQIAEKIIWEREVDKAFDDALKNRDFKLYLQPKVSVEKKKTVGAEALVRWIHPVYGMISPADFIPILENNGKIKKLDLYMFEEVCRWMKKRSQKGEPLYPVSVNLSRNHFMEENFLEPFIRLSKDYEIDPNFLEFEITEGIFVNEAAINRIQEGIRQMHCLGFRCSIDDFGVGYSSLSLIREFDVDSLKLDRSFFVDLTCDKARDIVSCIAALAEKLDIQTVVEGIETQDQINYLKKLQCDVVQGYFFSKPLFADDFEKWEEQFERKPDENIY